MLHLTRYSNYFSFIGYFRSDAGNYHKQLRAAGYLNKKFLDILLKFIPRVMLIARHDNPHG